MSHIDYLYTPDFSKPITITPLHESSFSKEIRICMQKDAQMKEHTAPQGISIQLLTGDITLYLGSKTYHLKPTEVIVLEASVPHSLLSHQDSIIRLSLSKQDSIQRVMNAVKL